MKELPETKNKMAYICQTLRRETLEPAQQEAERLLEEAEQKRAALLEETDKECEKRLANVQKQIEQEQNLFKLSLEHAGKQSIALLKQQIEETLFRPAIIELIDKQSSSPETIATFLNGVIAAIEKQGINADIEAILPKTVSPQAIMPLLMQQVAQRLKKQGAVRVGSFGGGVQIRLKDKNMVLDLSDIALQQLLSSFLRESFQGYLFSEQNLKQKG